METREWSLDRNGRRYSIALQHNPAESFLDILVNDTSVVVRPERRVDGSTEYRFTVVGDPASIIVRANGQQYSYELKVAPAGAKPGTETKVVTPVAMPRAPTPMPAAAQRGSAPTPGPRALPAVPERATPLQSPVSVDPGAEAAPALPKLKLPSPRLLAVSTILVVLVVALVGLIRFVVTKQAEWSPYQDTALGFEVEFPPGPLSRSQGKGWFTLAGQQGDVELTKLSGLGASWEIDLMRTMAPAEPEKVVQEAEEELRHSHTVTKFERLQGATSGFEAEVMTRSGPGSLRVEILGRRVYTVSVRAGFAVKPELRTRFFDSFKPAAEQGVAEK